MSANEIKQDEIIRMAREAGLFHEDANYQYMESYVGSVERFYRLAFTAGTVHEREKAKAVFEELEREVKAELINAINGAVELEREACAKVCEKAKIQMNYSEAPYNQCAAAIRARGEK